MEYQFPYLTSPNKQSGALLSYHMALTLSDYMISQFPIVLSM